MKALYRKYYLTFAVINALLVNQFVQAQDTLHFRNGNLVPAKVLEITTTLIKYKKMENIDGPIYSDFKNDVDYVKYQNGQIEKFEYQKSEVITILKKEPDQASLQKLPVITKFGTKFLYGNHIITNSQMYDAMLALRNPKITNHINLAKQQRNWQYIGFAAIPCGIGALALLDSGNSGSTGLFDIDTAGDATVVALIGAACITTSITLKVKRNKNEAAALKLYQQMYQ